MGTLAAIGVKIGLAAALAVGAVLVTRYLQQARTGWQPSARSLRVLETAVLGQQRAVHLIAVGGRTLLVASTQGQVTLLADVTGEPPAAPLETAPAPPSFAAVISRLLTPPQVVHGHEARLRAAAERLKRTALGGAR